MIQIRCGPGLPSWSRASIIADMGWGAKTCGAEKCRKFTNLVNICHTMAVVSAALPGHYCAFWRRLRGDSATIGGVAVPARTWLAQYCLSGLTAMALLALTCASAHAQGTDTTSARSWLSETGVASYYGRAHQGRRTASGNRFDQNALTAAHPWLPFGTKVRVTLEGTSRSVIVMITDRLYSTRRVIDLSVAAAQLLGMMRQGIAKVSLTPA